MTRFRAADSKKKYDDSVMDGDGRPRELRACPASESEGRERVQYCIIALSSYVCKNAARYI